MAIAAQPGKDEFANVRGESVPAGEDNHEAPSMLQAYVPITAYVPLFCLMAEDAGTSRAGPAMIGSPLAAGSITCVVNQVQITWVPPA